MNTLHRPPIVVTHHDHTRLERLLERANYQDSTVEALGDELDRARLVDPHAVPSDVVTMNSRARFRERLSGKVREVTLVFPEDAGVEGRVSVLTPTGAALLGLSVGQVIEWMGPTGRALQLELLAVEFQPEAAGDFVS
ncbi:MAG: nucleoside diphosphate kinase regulator [Polyangiales bacterium]|nr:nucleoside diphosphate kinase regulator [Myxococcales bacterium]